MRFTRMNWQTTVAQIMTNSHSFCAFTPLFGIRKMCNIRVTKNHTWQTHIWDSTYQFPPIFVFDTVLVNQNRTYRCTSTHSGDVGFSQSARSVGSRGHVRRWKTGSKLLIIPRENRLSFWRQFRSKKSVGQGQCTNMMKSERFDT